MSGEFLVAASLANFALVAYDKFLAEEGGGERRVSERHLHLAAALGGWPGGVLAMLLLSHKTSKRVFLARYAAAAALHVLLL